jgi:hypothetical protein
MRSLSFSVSSVLLASTFALLLSGTNAHAVDADVQAGIRLVEEGDYEGAIVVLDRAVEKLSGDAKKSDDLVQAYLYLGVAFVGKAHEEAAKRQFREALRLEDGLRLNAAEFPPKIIDLFEAARTEEETQTAKSTDEKEKTGGGKKWLFIGGGLAAAGGGAAILAGGGDGDSNGPSPLPASVAVSVSTTDVAIVYVTKVRFTATATNLSSPTFSWDFADGTTAAGDIVDHIFASEGVLNVTVTATGSDGRQVSNSVPVSVQSVSGEWRDANAGHADWWYFEYRIEQSGANLTGTGRVRKDPDRIEPWMSFTGTVRDPREFTWQENDPCGNTYVGTYDASLTQMIGRNTRPACNPSPTDHDQTMVRVE